MAFITVLFCAVGFSQTKKIQHKSHAGNMDELTINNNGNIGRFIDPTPKKLKKKVKVDTLTKQAMIYDSVSTYKFILDSNQVEPKVVKPKKKKLKK